MEKNVIEVILTTRNRPRLAIRAINSIVNQDDKNFDFWVSDNSTDQITFNSIKREFPDILMICRGGSLSAFQHFKECFSDASANYVVVMHDDDVLLPNFIQICRAKINRFGELQLILNRVEQANNNLEQAVAELSFNDDKIICAEDELPLTDPRVISTAYLRGNYNFEFLSFSMTVFKRSAVLSCLQLFEARTLYADALIILSVACSGQFIINSRTSGIYEIQDDSLTGKCTITDLKIFINLLLKNFYFIPKADVAYHLLRSRWFFRHDYIKRIGYFRFFYQWMKLGMATIFMRLLASK